MSVKVRIIVLYIIGIICILYPVCSRFIAYKNQTESVYDYEEALKAMEDEEKEDLNKKAEEFNDNASSQTTVIDSSVGDTQSYEETISSYNFLELGEIIGYITIDKINITLPIYEGITTNNLSKGVGHITNTSLPNGDESTHSVLCGHTGISGTEIFDNIDVLQDGDSFKINFYGTETTYKVISIVTVAPDDTSSLSIEEGRTLVTLVTCTPKSLNTHRLLITGEKVEEDIAQEETENTSLEESNTEEDTDITKENIFLSFFKRNIKMFIIIFVFILFIILLNILMSVIRKKKSKKENKNTEK